MSETRNPSLAEKVEGLSVELGCRVAAYAPYYAVTEFGAVWSIASLLK